MVHKMYKITSFNYINNHKDKTILFLHGWGCSLKYMLPISNINSANSLLIDLPGFGNNLPLSNPFTYEEYIDSIISFLNDNDFKIDIVVGHSFGGKLAIGLANKLNLSSIILIAPSTFNKKRSLLYYLKIYTYKLFKKIKYLHKYLSSFGSEDYKVLSPIMKKTMSNVINYKVTDYLKNIKIPTLIIQGNKDKITPYYIAKKTKKYIKDSEIIIIDGNHFAYLNNSYLVSNIIESMVKQ